ncbi:hypothetical protein ASC90_00160 [Rhizobium sp. Root1220]|nr:hypothetical protein ASC90_00160 [Rhizobium sp. Root1220]
MPGLDFVAALGRKSAIRHLAFLVFIVGSGRRNFRAMVTAMSVMTLTKFLRDNKVMSDTPGRIAITHGFRSSFGTGHLKRTHLAMLRSRRSPILSKMQSRVPTIVPTLSINGGP